MFEVGRELTAATLTTCSLFRFRHELMLLLTIESLWNRLVLVTKLAGSKRWFWDRWFRSKQMLNTPGLSLIAKNFNT